MTCSDVQRVLPEMMEGEQNSEFQAHLQACANCSELVADLELIAREARQLVESEEPAPRVWVAISNQLRSEGLIREPEPKTAQPVLVPSERRRWNAWWLVPVAAAVLVAGALLVKTKPAGEIAAQKPAVTTPAVQGTTTAEVSSAEDEQFLDAVSQNAPMMRATYENELRSVNSCIHDARSYAESNPSDPDARQQLMDAYQQKALLYQMALDHIQ